jgi:hypothetical protein
MVDLLGAPPEARRSGGLLRIELKKELAMRKIANPLKGANRLISDKFRFNSTKRLMSE